MARISIQEEDWANAIAYAEKARTLVKDIEKDRGISVNEYVEGIPRERCRLTRQDQAVNRDCIGGGARTIFLAQTSSSGHTTFKGRTRSTVFQL